MLGKKQQQQEDLHHQQNLQNQQQAPGPTLQMGLTPSSVLHQQKKNRVPRHLLGNNCITSISGCSRNYSSSSSSSSGLSSGSSSSSSTGSSKKRSIVSLTSRPEKRRKAAAKAKRMAQIQAAKDARVAKKAQEAKNKAEMEEWAHVRVWVEQLKLEPNQKTKVFSQLVVCDYKALKHILEDEDDLWFSKPEASDFSLRIRVTLKKAVKELRRA
jgi:hypothetical protein